MLKLFSGVPQVKMAFPSALTLLAVATLLCSAATVDANRSYKRPDFLPLLPSSLRLPGDCGSVYQVLPGDSCQSIACVTCIDLS